MVFHNDIWYDQPNVITIGLIHKKINCRVGIGGGISARFYSLSGLFQRRKYLSSHSLVLVSLGLHIDVRSTLTIPVDLQIDNHSCPCHMLACLQPSLYVCMSVQHRHHHRMVHVLIGTLCIAITAMSTLESSTFG